MFWVQKLSEINLIDVSSAKLSLKVVSVDMFFVLFGTISQILGPTCEGDSKKYLLLVLCTVIILNLKQSLTSFRDKPLTTLYSSVIETYIFIWCAQIWSWYMIYMKLNYILFIINYHWKVRRQKIYYHCILYANISRMIY